MRPDRAYLAAATVVFAAAIAILATDDHDRVPAHLTGDGTVDSWTSPGASALWLGALGCGLTLLMLAIGVFTSKMPDSLINLPSRRSREYWLSAEHRPEFDRRFAVDMRIFAANLLILLAALVAILLAAADDGRMSPGLLWTTTGAYLLVTAVHVGWLMRVRYRVPG